MKHYAAAACICLATWVMPAWAGAGLIGEGTYFSHGDWELACDNTHTCRAAGYQAEGEDHAVSVLLTRKAGAGQAVTGQLALGDYGDEESQLLDRLPDPITLSMAIDGRPQGTVSMDKKILVAELAQKQVAALVASLARQSTVSFTAGKTTWHLSGSGAAAVLLKMDDYQGRVGTRGALVGKGALGVAGLKPPLPAPVVHKAHVLDRALGPAAMFPPHDRAELRKALAAGAGEDCDASPDPDEPDPLQAARLDGHRLLVSVLCWRGPYNEGYGFWVVNDKPPFQPVLVTTEGTDYADGTIRATQKGRGLADCGSTDEWVWDGSTFIHTSFFTWGLCRMVAAGGAWHLPTLVSDVR